VISCALFLCSLTSENATVWLLEKMPQSMCKLKFSLRPRILCNKCTQISTYDVIKLTNELKSSDNVNNIKYFVVFFRGHGYLST